VNSPSVPLLEVIKPGLLTTLQDLGRPGYQRYGVSPGGAMDPFALRLANRLVGNPEEYAALEITTQGPELRTLRDCVVAITGGNLSPTLESVPLPLWRSVHLNEGKSIVFRERISGARAYLSIAGGFFASQVLGSRSTDLQSRFGGLKGRRLLRADVLLRNGEPQPHTRPRQASSTVLKQYRDPLLLRVIAGPQAPLLSPGVMEEFLRSDYLVTPASNRVGYRLEGPPIRVAPPEIISDPVPFGAVQLLPSGQPILLMADHQTVGGYPKIATLIAADVPKAAQLSIGDRIQFRRVSLEEAHHLLKTQEMLIETAVSEE
jgi:antagonist of KipI